MFIALLQFSGSDEEKAQVDSFNSSLSSLVSSGNVFVETPNDDYGCILSHIWPPSSHKLEYLKDKVNKNFGLCSTYA